MQNSFSNLIRSVSEIVEFHSIKGEHSAPKYQILPTILLFLVLTLITTAAAPGDLDQTFSLDGKTTVNFPNKGNNEAFAAALQADGKIITVGTSQLGSGETCSVTRFNADGTIDNSFGTAGNVITNYKDSDLICNAGALQPDGKIVAAGYVYNGSRIFAVVRFNPDGALDTTFDGDGIVVTPILTPGQANAITVQPDGKIVAAGDSFSLGSGDSFTIVRYNTDGSLDTSFGGDGIVTTKVRADGIVKAVAMQPDGKIVAAGYDYGSGLSFSFALVRYNPDGSLDTSFDEDGKIITAFSNGAIANAAAIQSDGKIVAAGSAGSSFALVRYNPDGSLDTSFDLDGKVETNLGGSSPARGVTIQTDGKIVAAGFESSSNFNIALVRFNTDGSLDTTFDGDGKVITGFGTRHSRANAVAAQSDGKIIAAGYAGNGSNRDFALIRYNSDGSLDTSFDDDGKAAANFGDSANAEAKAVAIQSDGKIVAAGYSFNGSNNFSLVRFNADGSLDTTFDGDGKVLTPFLYGSAANAVVIQSDGKIIAAGYFFDSYTYIFTVVRYNSDGSLDTSFGGDGIIITPILEFSQANALALQPDGKILAAGCASTDVQFPFPGFCDTVLVRYNPDGSLDTSFNEDGIVITAVSYDDQANAVMIQADGKIVTAGYASSGSDRDIAVVRYNPDGSLDTSFDEDGTIITRVSTSNDVANAVTIQSDGKILIAGLVTLFTYEYNNDFVLARYNPDGSLDFSFDEDGIVITRVLSGGNNASAVAVQSDGKIMAAGSSSQNSDNYFSLVRYNSDGSIDNSYGNSKDSLYGVSGKVLIDFEGSRETASAMALDNSGRAVVVGSAGRKMAAARVLGNQEPPAANVSVSGKVQTAAGRGIPRAMVSITNSNGQVRTTVTNQFGAFQFENVAAGENYLVNVNAKGFFFTLRKLNISQDIKNLIITGQ